MKTEQEQSFYMLIKYGKENESFNTKCSTIVGALADFGEQLGGETLSLFSSGQPNETVYSLLEFQGIEVNWASKINVYGVKN